MEVSGKPEVQPPRVSQAVVLCPKCQTRNNPELARCSACGADLLPGRSGRERLGYLIFGVVFATAVMVLAAVLADKGVELPLCVSPTGLAMWSLLLFFGALRLGLGRTSRCEKYLNRAQRHQEAFPEQAVADLTKALELAPEGRKSAILKQRGDLLSKLGRAEQALEDLSAHAAAPEQGGGARLLSRVSDIDIEPSADAATVAEISRLQRQLIESGARQWIGYCKKCRATVPVDVDRHCTRCGTPLKDVQLVRPEERDLALAKLTREQTARRRKRSIGIALAAVALLLCVVLPLAAVVPQLARQLTTRATPTPRAAAAPSTQGVFREDVFSFSYPTDWQHIGPAEVSTLLKISLKGMTSGAYSYIGGVYTNGLDNCKGCAQIVVIVATDASLPGTLTDAQYQAFRQASEQAMGARLLSHRKVEVSSMPAAESIHLGLSGDAKLWELIIVPPQPGVAYMFSCSSHKDSYAAFEPVFRQAIAALHIAGGAPAPAPTAVPPATPLPAKSPVAGMTYTVKSGDTLGQIAKSFGVSVEALAMANGIADPNLIRPGQVLTIPVAAR